MLTSLLNVRCDITPCRMNGAVTYSLYNPAIWLCQLLISVSNFLCHVYIIFVIVHCNSPVLLSCCPCEYMRILDSDSVWFSQIHIEPIYMYRHFKLYSRTQHRTFELLWRTCSVKCSNIFFLFILIEYGFILYFYSYYP